MDSKLNRKSELISCQNAIKDIETRLKIEQDRIKNSKKWLASGQNLKKSKKSNRRYKQYSESYWRLKKKRGLP